MVVNRKTNPAWHGAAVLFIVALLAAVPAHAIEVLSKDAVIKTIAKTEEFTKAVDNFIIIFDASPSMNDEYRDSNQRKIEVAQQLLRERNRALPPLGYKAALYVFSPDRTLYPMSTYNKEKYGQAIDQLPFDAIDEPPIATSIAKLDSVLKGLKGRTAVFFMTDGDYKEDTVLTPRDALRKLAADHDVCFYFISSAKSPQDQRRLEQMASVNECSRVISFDALHDRWEYFSGLIFFVESSTVVEEAYLKRDQTVKVEPLLFPSGGTAVSLDAKNELTELAGLMKENPQAHVVLVGHSDNAGPASANMRLSRERVQSVTKVLTGMGIARDRIVTLWYGERSPVADNATAGGRARNRRVMCYVGGLN